jgi:hypothetical protein
MIKTLCILALSIGTLSAQVEIFRGTYTQMVASTNTTENDIWMLVDAQITSVCTQGGGSAKAVCIKNAVGIWESITASGGAAPPLPGTDTTIRGGFTGGGTTVTLNTCGGTDDTTLSQTALSSVTNNGTLDLTGATRCAIGTAGLTRPNMTNIRITSSNGLGGFKQVAAGLYTPQDSTMLFLDNCTNCLVDKLEIDGNSKKGQGVYFFHGSGNSAQNLTIHHINHDTGGTGPYAAIKIDDCTNCFAVGNNIHDLTGADPGEAVRGIWMGVGNNESFNPTIQNNTVTELYHTGIVSESGGAIITGNQVKNVRANGTCIKVIPKNTNTITIDNNTCDGTRSGGGIQYEPLTAEPIVNIRNNQCKNVSAIPVSTGPDVYNDFGCLYVSGAGSGGGSHNINFTGNTLTNTRAIANINNGHDILLQNNTIIAPFGNDGLNVNLENDNTNIRLLNSGNANIFSPACDACTGIYEDGIQLAWLPRVDRNAVLAMIPWRREEGE